MNLWTLIDLTESNDETGSKLGMVRALEHLKPTRRECEIIARQAATVANRVREAIEGSNFGKQASQTTTIVSHGRGSSTGEFPAAGASVKVSLGSDTGFGDFLCWIPSRGQAVCLQLVADPESLLPPNNWDLFESDRTRWTPHEDESYFEPLNEYWRKNHIHVFDPDHEDPIDTYYEYPLDGFVSRPPPAFSTKASVVAKTISMYEETIRALATEQTAEAYYKSQREDADDDE